MDKQASLLNKGKASVSTTTRIFLGKKPKKLTNGEWLVIGWEIVAILSFIWRSFYCSRLRLLMFSLFMAKSSCKEKRFGINRSAVSRQSPGKKILSTQCKLIMLIRLELLLKNHVNPSYIEAGDIKPFGWACS